MLMRLFDIFLSNRLRRRLVFAGCSAPCGIAVIPAKAGIQALNGIARLVHDLKSYVLVALPLHPFVVSPSAIRP
jgi:hypothetical protein